MMEEDSGSVERVSELGLVLYNWVYYALQLKRQKVTETD